MSTITASGCSVSTSASSRCASAACATTSMPGSGQQVRDPLPGQHRVVRDRYPHGSTACTCRSFTRSVPPAARTRSSSSTVRRRCNSVDADRQAPVRYPYRDRHLVGGLGRVRERGRRPGRPCARSRRAVAPRGRWTLSTGTSVLSVRLHSAGPRPDSSRIAGKMPWAMSRRSASAAGARCDGGVEHRRLTRIGGLGAGETQFEGDGQQPLLRAVVQVALDPAAGVVRGPDDATADRPERLELVEYLGHQPLVVDGEPRRRPDLVPEFAVVVQRAIVGDDRDRAPGCERRSWWPAPGSWFGIDGFPGRVHESTGGRAASRPPTDSCLRAIGTASSAAHRPRAPQRDRPASLRHRRSTSPLLQSHAPRARRRPTIRLSARTVDHGQKACPSGILGRIDEQCRRPGWPRPDSPDTPRSSSGQPTDRATGVAAAKRWAGD